MSVSFKVVLAAIFPNIYQYDNEYDELFANTKLNILEYPYPIRKLFYDYYNIDMDKNKMITTQDINNFMNNDKELLYVKNPINPVVWYDDKLNKIEHVKYNHFVEQDYKYLYNKQNVRNHMTLKYIVFYETFNDYNINNYIHNNLYPMTEKYDKQILSRVISYDCIIKYYNDINKFDLNINIIIERFLTNENELIEFANKLKSDKLRIEYYKSFILYNHKKYISFTYNKWKVLDGYDNIIYPLMINYYNSFLDKIYIDITNGGYNNIYNFVKHGLTINGNTEYNKSVEWFNIAFIFIYFLNVNDLLTIENEIFDMYIKCCDNMKYTNEKLKYQIDIINKFDNKYICDKIYYRLENLDDSFYKLSSMVTIINNYNIFKYIDDMNEYIKFVEEHKQQFDNFPRVIFIFLIEMLRRYEYFIKIDIDGKQTNNNYNIIKLEDIKQYIYKFKSIINYYSYTFNNHTLGYYWVKYIHSDPIYEIYPSPLIDNLASVWRTISSIQPPKEMTDIKYYNYMIKNNGIKRPQNITAFYSYFSNTNENKFIFINNDNILENEARLRYIIPIDYQRVKTFLTEELETNDICLFTNLTDKDWQKVAGGNDRIDCVVFSDWANVFRHRTTPIKLIKYFKESIELKFDIELKDETPNE